MWYFMLNSLAQAHPVMMCVVFLSQPFRLCSPETVGNWENHSLRCL